MSITGALSNALSGLRASGRGTELVSSNIANATNKGYGRRLLELSTGALGGVKVSGISRAVNEGLVAYRRAAQAAHSEASTIADFLTRLSKSIGSPDKTHSISGKIARFEAGLISAASRPDAPERLSGSVIDARDLVTSISQASQQIQDARSAADRAIGTEVEKLNNYLAQVQELNAQITSVTIRGEDGASLRDHRQKLVDDIAAIVPINQVPRDHGQIRIYSTGGAILLDGTAQEIGFTATSIVTPYQTLSGGHLSGLTIGGIPMSVDSETGALSGGSLGAHFKVRDELGEQAQAKLDALARDLIERFQDPGVDPSLGVGDAGLFTDSGAVFDPVDELGISSRLSINAAVDPKQGGLASRLRDGINSATVGPVGNAVLLNALKAALTTARAPASGGFGGGSFTSASLVASYGSDVGSSLNMAEQNLAFTSSRLQETTERQLADGVDTDTELQSLLVLERAYAANAKVIQSVDDMMQSILRI